MKKTLGFSKALMTLHPEYPSPDHFTMIVYRHPFKWSTMGLPGPQDAGSRIRATETKRPQRCFKANSVVISSVNRSAWYHAYNIGENEKWQRILVIP